MLGDSFSAISPLAINVGLESAGEEKFCEETLRASRSILSSCKMRKSFTRVQT